MIAPRDGQKPSKEARKRAVMVNMRRMPPKREGDRGINQLKISSLRVTKSATQLHPVGVPVQAATNSERAHITMYILGRKLDEVNVPFVN